MREKIYLTERAKSEDLLVQYIRERRLILGMTQVALSKKLGMGITTLRSRLDSPGRFTWSELRTLFKVLRFSKEQIEKVLL